MVWSGAAWWCARIARLILHGSLGRNLAADREDQDVLSCWRSWLGAPALHRPASSYTDWAAWVVACAFPLLAWAWLSLSGKPWRVEPGPFAVAFVLWLSWTVHLLLKGMERIPAGEAREEAPAAKANGWPEILAWLEVAGPEPAEPPHLVEPLQLSSLPPETDGVISPLALELLPEPRRLTGLQRTVLSDLSLQAFVHVDPPARHGELELEGLREEAVRDRTRPAVPLAQVDAGAAGFLYYPGRIFTDARGSFVVVGRAADEVLEDGTPLGKDDVLVEPILGDGLSTPRRRIECRLLGPDPEIRTVPPEPVLLGRFPLQVGLVAVGARPRHVATYRLGAARRDVRQRLMRGDDRAPTLKTAALAVWPNPDLGSGEAPRLAFGGARLLAAALRCVLPSVVRGAAESLEVALHVEGTPGPDHELGPEEALLVFDMDEGGNGAARALHRDGLEPLLRLCRRLLERIPDPNRLQVLHDHWADEAEILAEAGLKENGGVWEDARRQVLDWLDSRTSL